MFGYLDARQRGGKHVEGCLLSVSYALSLRVAELSFYLVTVIEDICEDVSELCAELAIAHKVESIRVFP
jgi:hypothetical protein